ncbi:cation/H(+) antiporter 4-like [Hibiscus syriacus]|uniref:cation/H(+) antiporter 4-like n=1 Tax=Hibiscus syriacus TaxID=106335 RepID=UPI0019208785|nr:cation/H(+) antiporter 4-like [Hibiscus syriacus]
MERAVETITESVTYLSVVAWLLVFSDATFSVLTLAVLVNATIIPVLVKYLYYPVSRRYASYQQKNIMHLKPDSELGVVACVHRPEHVSALVDVLDITCPTKESPNIVYVLHLIELVGRDSPVFIAHQKHENRVTGILVDWRRKLLTSSASTYNVGIIFLGGKDDQEALTLVKRMARDPRVNLTVIHLIPDENCRNVIDWDSMLDAETLKDIKQNDDSHGCCVKYIIQVSKDGQQSSRIIQSIAGDYDLIIVGRRYGVDSVQTIGLSEWSEFPELGVIGDLLESIDISSRASILVVQQHNYVD